MVILTIMLVQVLYCHSITKITRNGINGAMFVSRNNFSQWFLKNGVKTYCFLGIGGTGKKFMRRVIHIDHISICSKLSLLHEITDY